MSVQYKNITIIHPGAIGDAVMGTPVAHALKRAFPGASVSCLTHPSLFPLLELSSAIDTFLEWQRDLSIFELSKELRNQHCDLAVDLVGSLRTRAVAFLSGARTLTYSKWRGQEPVMHVVDNYLNTLQPLQAASNAAPFPSLFPPSELTDEVLRTGDICRSSRWIALVPGVGKHRPNRAWPAEHWAEIGERILKSGMASVVLVGGPDDAAACDVVDSLLAKRCKNLAGRLTIAETAALLSKVDFVVSADTGPAHIAVSVGKPVICLMGPTDPKRTGPYNMHPIGLYAGDACKCRNAKICSVVPSGVGACMRNISVDEVFNRLQLQWQQQCLPQSGAAKFPLARKS